MKQRCHQCHQNGLKMVTAESQYLQGFEGSCHQCHHFLYIKLLDII